MLAIMASYDIRYPDRVWISQGPTGVTEKELLDALKLLRDSREKFKHTISPPVEAEHASRQ